MRISEANRLRILYFLFFSCTAAWLPIFADYLKDRGLSGVEIGVILSVTPFMMFLFQPFYGLLADRLGYKACLVVSALLAAASYFLYLFDGSFVYLFVITVAMSLFYNSIQPLLDSIALAISQRNAAFSYGTLRFAGAAGWACTGFVTGYLIDQLNTTVIFSVSAVSMALTFLIALTLRTEKAVVSREYHPVKLQLRELLGNRALMFLLLAAFLVYAASAPIYYFYSIYMKENGASSSLIGFAITFQGLCEIPLFYFSSRIIKRLGLKQAFLLCIAATSLRLVLYSITENPYAAVSIELLHGIGWSLFLATCVEQVNRLVREELRATGQSLLYAALLGAGAIVGNLWAGYLYEEQLKIAQIYLLNAGIVFLIFVFMLFFMRSSASGTSR